MDARPANQKFKPPPRMPLGGSASWAAMQYPADRTLYTSQYDVEAYFYRCGIPDELGKHVSLPAVSCDFVSRCIGIDALKGSDPSISWHPFLRVAPMGWNWAMFFCQRVHVQAIIRSGLPASHLVLDGQPPQAA